MSIRKKVYKISTLIQTMNQFPYTIHKFEYCSNQEDMEIMKKIILNKYHIVRLTIIINGHQHREMILVGNKLVYISEIGYLKDSTYIMISPNKISLVNDSASSTKML